MTTPPPQPPGQPPPEGPGGPTGGEPAWSGQPGPSQDDRNWAVAAHLAALVQIASIPSFVGPLVIWLLKRDQPFVNEHGREALNFNISLLIYVVVLVILTVLTLGLFVVVLIPLGLAIAVLWLIFLIQGAMRASRGELYRYPLTIRLIS
jgi:uncharacterized protein